MIYVATLKIANHNIWGSIYQRDIALPMRVKRINGAFANVVLDEKTELCKTSDIVKDAQIGVASLSLNNTDIIIPCLALCVLEEMKNSSINQNMVTLAKSKDIILGSILKVIIEERISSPFVQQKEKETDNVVKENGYTIKIYIDYDK